MKSKGVLLWLTRSFAVPLLAREKSDVIIMKNGDRITRERAMRC
jgi:hypothetical protein